MRLKVPKLVAGHALALAVGIVTGAHALAVYLGGLWEKSGQKLDLAAWAVQPTPPKIESIIEYALLIALGGGLAFAVHMYVSRTDRSVELGHWYSFPLLILYEGLCLLIPLFDDSLLVLVLWMVLALLLPSWVLSLHLRTSARGDRISAAAALAYLAVVLCLLFSTSWSWEVNFVNDYAGFPEYTLMDDGAVVDNATYRSGNRDLDEAKEAEGGRLFYGCITLPRTVFTDSTRAFQLFPPASGLRYDWDASELCAHRALTQSEIALVEGVWGRETGSEEYKRFLSEITRGPLRAGLRHAEKPNASDVHAVEDRRDQSEFYRKNEIELQAQQALGRFFYHQAYLYLPALERDGDSRQDTTPSQYGAGLTETLGFLLQQFGRSFQSYYHLYWLSFGIYLVLVGYVVWKITHELWAVVCSVALAIASILGVSYDALRMAPGFNPIRHFPDLLALWAVFYDSKKNNVVSAVLRVVTIAFLVWWNREFGLFLLGGSIVWLCFNVVSGGSGERRKAIVQIAFEAGAATLVLMFKGLAAGGDVAFYNLMGVGAPVTRWRDVFGWLFLWSPLVAWLVWIRFIRPPAPDDRSGQGYIDVAGVGLVYAGLVSVYPLWNPSPNHVSVVLLCSVVPVTALLQWLSRWPGSRWAMRYGALSTILVMSTLLGMNHKAYNDFQRVFSEHRVFHWQFAGLDGKSTADSRPMQESVALIDKYVPSGGVLLISRFNTLLRTLTGRPGLLPYVDISSIMVEQAMIERVASQILRLNEPVIFVDRDIYDVSIEEERTFVRGAGLGKDAEFRIGSLAALAEMFRKVAHCYTPGETAGMLRVWHRTCSVSKNGS